MSCLNRLAVFVNSLRSPRSADPIDEFSWLLLVWSVLFKSFPPYFALFFVKSNVGEYRILSCRRQSIVVGLGVCTRSYAEETIFRIDSIKSAVRSFLDPGDVVADCVYLVTVLSVSLRRNKHCKVGLAASRRECCAHINRLFIRLLDAENEHMLSHPHFILTLV